MHISLSSRRPCQGFREIGSINIFFCFVICRFCPHLPKVEAPADHNGSNNLFCYTVQVTRGPLLALTVSILDLIVEFFASSFRLFILFINSVAKSNMRDVHVLFRRHKDVQERKRLLFFIFLKVDFYSFIERNWSTTQWSKWKNKDCFIAYGGQRG